MLNPLNFRPTLVSRETAPSFLSRMAAMNGVSSAEFAVDMGFSLKRIVNGDNLAIECLAELGGLDLDQLTTLRSWTGQTLGNVRMSFRSEVYVTRALRATTVKGCPACLREDVSATDGNPRTAMVMRGDWLLRSVNLCLRHQYPLVELWSVDYQPDRYDAGSRLSEISAMILNGALDRPQIEPQAYDHWLDRRLEDGTDETWLGSQSLYAATTFCELLGTAMLRPEMSSNVHDKDLIGTARAIGFNVARQGEGAIRSALDDLASSADGARDEPSGAFGQLFIQLSRAYRDEEDFTPFRDILRNCIFDIWPISTGLDVLGQSLSERRLHSVSTASTEFGVGKKLLTQFLVQARVLAEDDIRPNARKTFDAKKYSPLLTEISNLVGPIEMCKEMGATHNQFHSLVEDQIIVPMIDIPTIQSPWRRGDGTALVAELTALAMDVRIGDKKWEPIQRAKNRSGIRVGAIIHAIRKRQIQVGLQAGQVGYSAFCVVRAEIDLMVKATMALEYGIDRRTLLTRLKSSEIHPFKPKGEDYGPLYLRRDVDALLK